VASVFAAKQQVAHILQEGQYTQGGPAMTAYGSLDPLNKKSSSLSTVRAHSGHMTGPVTVQSVLA
jgi:hypothetical protein